MHVLTRKWKNALGSSVGGGRAAWCLSGVPVSAVAAAPCGPPPDLAGALTPQLGQPAAGKASVSVLGCTLPLVSKARQQVRRQECLP